MPIYVTGLQDKIQINCLQMQLQAERQQRAIEGLERRFELKLEEVKDSITQLKTQKDQLFFNQEEIQNIQKQRIFSSRSNISEARSNTRKIATRQSEIISLTQFFICIMVTNASSKWEC